MKTQSKKRSSICQRQICKKLTKGKWYSDGLGSVLKFDREEDGVLLFSTQAGRFSYSRMENGLIPFMKQSLFFRLDKSDKELIESLDIVQ